MALWNEDDLHLVVGIDFGTTYSGVAWALSNKPNSIGIITGWESELDNSERSDKVPTVVSYSKNGEFSSWGFQEHDDKHLKLSRVKLLLCEEAKNQAGARRSFIDQLEKDLKALKISPQDAVSDYLRQLWGHATSVIKKDFMKEFFDDLPIKLVMTVPAMWDHSAQELTKTAVKGAGITTHDKFKLELVSEPEAAARYIFSRNPSLKAGDAFVVCDAGGGTIDLISYKVEQLSPLRLTMCTEATGDLFGAVYLDDAFIITVRNKIGEPAFKQLSSWSKSKLLSDWENYAKRNFRHGTPPDRTWSVSIPGYVPTRKRKSSQRDSPAGTSGCERGRIILKTSELELTFQEVCPRIIGLIQQQISALKKCSALDAKAIILVGGFGENRYLHEELEMSFPGIEVLKPINAWSAISRGAVLKGISDEMIINHVAKYHYGIKVTMAYDDTKHDLRDKVWSKIRHCNRAKNQMHWYIRRGENISKDQQVEHSFRRDYTKRSRLTDSTESIYYSRSEQAPGRATPEVLKLCTITTHFNPDIFETLPKYANPVGQKYRKLTYTIKMKVTSSGLEWTVHHDGEEMGRATVDVVYT